MHQTRLMQIMAFIAFALTEWAAWRSHAWGKGAFALPIMLFICALVGVSGYSLCTMGGGSFRRWSRVLPGTTLIICLAFILGQIMAAYTTWTR